MANPSPPPLSTSLLFLFLLLLTTAAGCDIVTQELESMLQSLRNHGFTLFSNAITTSDIQYHLHNTASPFTIFAPKDSLLFALDMVSDAATYVSMLKYHVIPRHSHTLADLRNLSSSFLETLLPHYSVLIGTNTTVGVIVDGVGVSAPDLFLGSRIAVHGIDGILVTGLNMYQDPDEGAGFSPAESPTALSGNILSPTPSPPQFGWSEGPIIPGLDQGKKLKNNNNLGKKKKKKRGKRSRRDRGQWKHKGVYGHRLDDL